MAGEVGDLGANLLVVWGILVEGLSSQQHNSHDVSGQLFNTIWHRIKKPYRDGIKFLTFWVVSRHAYFQIEY